MVLLNNFVELGLMDFDTDTPNVTTESILAFVGFMLFVFSIVFIFAGIVNISSAKRNWNLFYDQRDQRQDNAPDTKKQKITGIVLLVIGIVFLIVSFFL